MKRERASVLYNALMKNVGYLNLDTITAYEMNGGGWSKSKFELMDLLEHESYVLYDFRFTDEGVELDVWFTTVSVG